MLTIPGAVRRTVAAGFVATALTLTAFATPAVGAAPSTSDPAQGAAGWLARQLTAGTHLTTTSQGSTFDDPGLTADAVLAFAAAGVAQTSADAATSWLAAHLSDYVGPGPGKKSTTGDKVGAAYAGALAKAALVAQVQDQDPASFGGRDLLSELADRESGTSAAFAGRFSDDSSFGDFSNAIGQSLAIVVQVRAGDGPSPAAVSSLGSLQCADGGVRVDYPKDPTKPGTCTGDVDATAFAAQAFRAAGDDAAAGKAVAYLKGAQQPSGAFSNASKTANANSTGVAGAALTSAGESIPGLKATAHLRSLQVKSGANAGAIAFDAKGFDKTTAPRATAQGILGLTGTDLVTLAAGSSAGPSAPVYDSSATGTPALSYTGAPAPLLPMTIVALVAAAVGGFLTVRFRRRPGGEPDRR